MVNGADKGTPVMPLIEIRDYALWPKHIHGDEALRDRLLALAEEELVELEIDGFRGTWKRMAQGRNAAPTPGLRALGAAREHWHKLFTDRRGELVAIEFVGRL